MIEIETTEMINPDADQLSLADQFREPEVVPQLEVTVAEVADEKAPLLSLPAALCDDKLLEEIQSIPTKMGFKIGEVADLLGIKQYVLRYWESEFDVLKPKKASNNQRYFTRKDVENAFLIRKLLHRDRFSIEGARAALRDLKTFVRKEVAKSKELTQIHDQFEHLNDQMDDLLIEIHKLKNLFI